VTGGGDGHSVAAKAHFHGHEDGAVHGCGVFEGVGPFLPRPPFSVSARAISSTTRVCSAGVVEWGDVPTWVQAAATVSLFAAAVVAGWYTHRIYKIEKLRDDRIAQERRAHQANRVAAWVEIQSEQCVIANLSNLPIYYVTLVYAVVDDHGYRHLGSVRGFEILPPGTATRPVPQEIRGSDLWAQINDGISRQESALRVQVHFVDSAGQHWVRNYNGGLEDKDNEDISLDREFGDVSIPPRSPSDEIAES
jgi:hypothetical protein